MAEGGASLARKRTPIEFQKGNTGPKPPANPNFSVRKAWPEEKYSIKLPSAFLEDPHTHRFQRAKPLSTQNGSGPSTVAPVRIAGPGPKLQQELPQKKSRVVSLKTGNGSHFPLGKAGGHPQQGVVSKQQGRVVAIAKKKSKSKKPKVPVANAAAVVSTSKIDLEEKLSMSLDALSKVNKGGVKKPGGKN
jgi:hypothetical protein